ncbi:MAG TPA: HNH endonuclease signature motif containing protein [Roseiarcus sp.]|nr:HNH endonuclease signature motif containing protein [Roseiarcus sp.]
MSRETPEPIKRLLRQEAGFGCCLCGHPIFQYHHIVEWADDQHFRPEDMMVLCPNHHDQATRGALLEDEQRSLKREPFNIRHGRAGGWLEVRQDYCAASLGSVMVVNEGPFLQIDGETMLSLSLGERKNLEVSLRLFSSADELLLEIDRNEWISGDPFPWDIEASWQTLTLRERARQITLSLDGRQRPLEVRGELWRNGKHFQIHKDRIVVVNKVGAASGLTIAELALVGGGLAIKDTAIELLRFDGGVIVSHADRRIRLQGAKDAWRRLKAERSTKGAGDRRQP